jgi:hypothetical protein
VSVSDDLLENCTDVESAYAMFNYCTSLSAIPDVFKPAWSPAIDNLAGCFRRCTAAQGDAPPFWTRYPDADGSLCFSYCPQLANLADIPAAWK